MKEEEKNERTLVPASPLAVPAVSFVVSTVALFVPATVTPPLLSPRLFPRLFVSLCCLPPFPFPPASPKIGSSKHRHVTARSASHPPKHRPSLAASPSSSDR